jgi:DNA-binding transcriptional LysR family regulator
MDVHGRDLRYFVEVADRLSFTRAAERLFISQPALSKQIRMLERQLGAPLFERDRRQVRLTSVGEALLPHARRMLSEWDDADKAVQAASARQRATLVVGISTSPGRGLLAAARSRFAAHYPAARLVLRQVGWSDPTAGLADSTTDVAFVWLPLPRSGRIDWTVVAREPRVVALPESHRLAGHESIEFQDLLAEPFLALPTASGDARDYWLANDSREGRPAIIGGEVASAEETHEAVRIGDGVVLLAAGNAPLIARDGVVVRPVRGVTDSELVLAWRRSDNRPLVHGYINACRLATGGTVQRGPGSGADRFRTPGPHERQIR